MRDDGGTESVEVEYSMLKDLRHDHVVVVKGFERCDGKACIYMEYIALRER